MGQSIIQILPHHTRDKFRDKLTLCSITATMRCLIRFYIETRRNMDENGINEMEPNESY